MKFQIKHNYKIPKAIVDKALDNIGKNIITFGVHAEDNNKTSNRQRVQNKPLHRKFYNNGETQKTISNAELLAKTERGFETTVYNGGKARSMVVPSRPVLEPIVQLNLDNFNIIRRGIKRQMSMKNYNAINEAMVIFRRKFDKRAVFDFVRNRGMGYWMDAEHNGPYTSAIKYFDAMDRAGIDYSSIINKNTGGIKNIENWNVSNIYTEGDMPLRDSLDLLNSIKAKVEKVR